MFWMGLILGLASGAFLTVTAVVVGEDDHSKDDYDHGYEDGFYDGVMYGGINHGSK